MKLWRKVLPPGLQKLFLALFDFYKLLVIYLLIQENELSSVCGILKFCVTLLSPGIDRSQLQQKKIHTVEGEFC